MHHRVEQQAAALGAAQLPSAHKHVAQGFPGSEGRDGGPVSPARCQKHALNHLQQGVLLFVMVNLLDYMPMMRSVSCHLCEHQLKIVITCFDMCMLTMLGG